MPMNKNLPPSSKRDNSIGENNGGNGSSKLRNLSIDNNNSNNRVQNNRQENGKSLLGNSDNWVNTSFNPINNAAGIANTIGNRYGNQTK